MLIALAKLISPSNGTTSTAKGNRVRSVRRGLVSARVSLVNRQLPFVRCHSTRCIERSRRQTSQRARETPKVVPYAYCETGRKAGTNSGRQRRISRSFLIG